MGFDDFPRTVAYCGCQLMRACRAYAVYRPHHIERGIGMVLKVVGLKPNGRFSRWVTRTAWWLLQSRVARLSRNPV
jgi:hypothetical protein